MGAVGGFGTDPAFPKRDFKNAIWTGTEAKIFASALGGGILIDATIIRGVLAPAVVALFGRWNWWLPDWAARILRVEPSPLEPEAPSQPAAPQVG